MRRFLAACSLVVLIIGGFVLWWYSRDTPAKVLRDGFGQLIEMKSAKQVTADISSTNPVTHVTTGFTSVSEVNVADLTHPQSLGILRIGARSSSEQDQTIDLVIDKLQAALRPRSVTSQYRSLYQQLSGDATGTTFLAVNRDAYLKANGYTEAIAKGKTADVRAALQYLLPIIVPGNVLTYSADKSQVSATFRFDRRTLQPFLIVLVHAWTGDNPTIDEYAWIDRATEDLARGQFMLTINRKTRVPLSLVGNFDLVDDAQRSYATTHVAFQLSGINEPVSISIPQISKDVTAQVTKPENSTTLPTSGERSASSTSFFAASGTSVGDITGGVYVTSVGNVVPETQIDLFQKYSDELRKNKNP